MKTALFRAISIHELICFALGSIEDCGLLFELILKSILQAGGSNIFGIDWSCSKPKSCILHANTNYEAKTNLHHHLYKTKVSTHSLHHMHMHIVEPEECLTSHYTE